MASESTHSYFFLHVPKAGGTTFRTKAPKFLGLQKCALTGCCKAPAKRSTLVARTKSQLQRKTCNFADFETYLSAFESGGVMEPLRMMDKFVIVRKPIIHLISQLEHDMRNGKRYGSLDEKVDIIHRNRWHDWRSTKGGYPLKNPQYARVIGSLGQNVSMWNLWQKLINTYHSIGLEEHMHMTFCVFYFNLHGDLPEACCNQSAQVIAPTRNSGTPKQEKRHQLRTNQIRQAHNWRQLDEILYSAAQTVFWKNAEQVANKISNCPRFHLKVSEQALSNVDI